MPFATAPPIPEWNGGERADHPGRAGMWAAGLLALLYAATAAPGVTWWDAGEFLTAAHTLGIPHPPGTPLYVMIAHSWSVLFGWLDTARSVNLLSAVCTALAAGIAASLMARATRFATAGVAAALCAATMSTVWLSATEAEVYGASLLLAMLMLWSGDRAGRSGDPRFVVLTAYLFALAAPLHVTALVAGPAAVLLAAQSPGDEVRWRDAALLGVALVAAGGIGTGRWSVGVAAIIGLVIIGVVPRARVPRAWLVASVVLVGLSGFLFLLLRARHDPGINQGNPSTVAALMSVIARDQYAVAGFFPRQAPVWLQIVNFFEYVDWQVALGLGPTVTPTVPRTAMTIAFIALGAIGSLAHRRSDERSWRAMALLGLSGSLGVIAYLNLKAGPSIGYGIIPDDAPHEPRERDYFFVLAFWTWGLWAGIGAVKLVTDWVPRRGWVTAALGLLVAALPAALNARATNRNWEPEASLPLHVARELLGASPDRALLLVAGDNDTYPIWYAQQVLGIRPDVIVVTYPLIGADWYRAELHRRWGLGSAPDRWRGMRQEMSLLASSAREQGRPLAAAVTVERTVREQLGPHRRLRGTIYIETIDSIGRGINRPAATDPLIDHSAVEESAMRLEALLRPNLREAIDPTGRLMRDALSCPALVLRVAADTMAARLLDSTCNYR